MSYHPRYSLISQQPVASSSRLPMTRLPSTPVINRHPEAPVGSKPIAVPKRTSGTRRGAKEVKVKATDTLHLMETVCNTFPFGGCVRSQTSESIYCVLHACRAVLDDGSTCGNLVEDPSKSRICTSGWHRENGQHEEVLRLLEKREALDQAETTQRLELERRFQRSSRSDSGSSWSGSPRSGEGYGGKGSVEGGCGGLGVWIGEKREFDEWLRYPLTLLLRPRPCLSASLHPPSLSTLRPTSTTPIPPPYTGSTSFIPNSPNSTQGLRTPDMDGLGDEDLGIEVEGEGEGGGEVVKAGMGEQGVEEYWVGKWDASQIVEESGREVMGGVTQ